MYTFKTLISGLPAKLFVLLLFSGSADALLHVNTFIKLNAVEPYTAINSQIRQPRVSRQNLMLLLVQFQANLL
jgi:hypothetical protein